MTDGEFVTKWRSRHIDVRMRSERPRGRSPVASAVLDEADDGRQKGTTDAT